MAKTLGGSFFVWNGIKQDYCFEEAIKCLAELCDELAIVYGGDDGTIETIEKLVESLSFSGEILLIELDKDTWDAHQGKEKLSYFTNMAIARLKTDWIFNLQADEIIHEDSFKYIREAIESDDEAFMCHRINLWASPYTALQVPQDRKPVSTEIVRLARQKYRAYDDAESLQVPSVSAWVPPIRIYHMGFVRNPVKHLVKIKHIQDEVFLMDHDKRIDGMESFDCWAMGFTPADVTPIEEPLPKLIRQWAKQREYDPFHPSEGYQNAKQFLHHIGEFGYVSTHGFSTDGWSIIAEANAIWWRLSKVHQ